MYNQFGRVTRYATHKEEVEIEWYQTKIKGIRAIVMREKEARGISLTNSIEYAISRMCALFEPDFLVGKPIRIFQDCGDEGIFELQYVCDFNNYTITREYYKPEVSGVNWIKFSDNLDTFNILYGRK